MAHSVFHRPIAATLGDMVRLVGEIPGAWFYQVKRYGFGVRGVGSGLYLYVLVTTHNEPDGFSLERADGDVFHAIPCDTCGGIGCVYKGRWQEVCATCGGDGAKRNVTILDDG